jgi:hypothetical protein
MRAAVYAVEGSGAGRLRYAARRRPRSPVSLAIRGRTPTARATLPDGAPASSLIPLATMVCARLPIGVRLAHFD